jgi:Ulp1 family protease
MISPNFLASSSKTSLPYSFIRKYSISDLRNNALQVLNDANNPNIIYTLRERSLSLRNSDVVTLFGSSLLNDIVIELFLAKLLDNLDYVILKNSFFLESFNPVKNIIYNIPNVVPAATMRKVVRQHKPSLTNNIKFIIFPVNIRNIHWVICIADIEEKKLILYDSLGTIFSDDHVNILSILSTFLKQVFRGSSWEHINIYKPSQNDKESCGVLVCAFVESIVRSGFNIGFEDSFNYINIPYLRLRMTAILSKLGDSQDI